MPLVQGPTGGRRDDALLCWWVKSLDFGRDDVFANIAGSACEDCARTGITGREEKKCPMCEEVANPEDLIPYRLFRDKVTGQAMDVT